MKKEYVILGAGLLVAASATAYEQFDTIQTIANDSGQHIGNAWHAIPTWGKWLAGATSSIFVGAGAISISAQYFSTREERKLKKQQAQREKTRRKLTVINSIDTITEEPSEPNKIKYLWDYPGYKGKTPVEEDAKEE